MRVGQWTPSCGGSAESDCLAMRVLCHAGVILSALIDGLGLPIFGWTVYKQTRINA